MPVPKNDKLLDRAKELRKEMTPQERKLWYEFLRGYPLKIYKQRIIESYIVDFYCASAKLVIELDGSQHYVDNDIEYDARRTACMEKHGLYVLRISNLDVKNHFREVCEMIDHVIKERMMKQKIM